MNNKNIIPPFGKLRNERIEFLNKNKDLDYAVISGKNNILLSAPHGVFQVRLGKPKYREPGSLTTALFLQKSTNSFLIAKTKNNNDDANFDQVSNYKDEIDGLILNHNIKYVLDFHSLSKANPMDINLGINLGRNIENNTLQFDNLVSLLKSNGFSVSIDQPFSGGINTIAGSTKNKHKNIFSIQIEINSNIANNPKNIIRFNQLLNLFTNWIINLEANL